MNPSIIIAVGAFALLACTDGPSVGSVQKASRAAQEPQADPVRDEYSTAVKLARGGNPDGYGRLLGIARGSQSAEWQEVAQDQLLHMLYEDPAGWLKGMTPLDGPELRAYLGKNGLYPNDLPPGIASDLEFERRCIARLRSAGVNEQERLLAAFIVKFYEEDLARAK